MNEAYWCNCQESSHALGLYAKSRPGEPTSWAPITPVRDCQCPYCGHYAVLSNENLLEHSAKTYDNKRVIKNEKERAKYKKVFNKLMRKYSSLRPATQRQCQNRTNEDGQRKARSSGWGDDRFDLLWG